MDPFRSEQPLTGSRWGLLPGENLRYLKADVMDDDEIRDWLPPELTNPAKDDVPQRLQRDADDSQALEVLAAHLRFRDDCEKLAASEANPKLLSRIAGSMMTRARVKRNDTEFFEWAAIRDSLMADEQF